MLRAVTAADLPTLKTWDEDPAIILLMGQRFAEIDVEQWYQTVRVGRSCRALAIETLAGRLIGEIELAQLNWRAGTAELRICLGERDCWGQGLGADALGLALGLAFEELHLGRIYLRVFTSNKRAIHLYERIGFRTEAVLEPSIRRGDPSSVLLMGLSRLRWVRLRGRTLHGSGDSGFLQAPG